MPTPAPGSCAVALHYEGQGAPKVIAQGQGFMAAQILEIARLHGVPLHEDAELAALLSQVSLGQEIPEALYVAVARVLAFAYRLSGKSPLPGGS